MWSAKIVAAAHPYTSKNTAKGQPIYTTNKRYTDALEQPPFSLLRNCAWTGLHRAASSTNVLELWGRYTKLQELLIIDVDMLSNHMFRRSERTWRFCSSTRFSVPLVGQWAKHTQLLRCILRRRRRSRRFCTIWRYMLLRMRISFGRCCRWVIYANWVSWKYILYNN